MIRLRVFAAAFCASLLVASNTAVAQPAAAPRISDGVVKIGVLTDLNGPYQVNVGQGSVVATEIAVEEFGGKVLGVPIVVVSADHQNKAEVGSLRTRTWMDTENVDVVSELGNSAVALAAMKVASEKGRLALVTGAGSVRIAGEDCAATAIHWGFDTYALSKIGTLSAQRNAKNWYFLTADHTGGQSLEGEARGFIEAANGKVVGTSRYPFPGTDFSSYLLQAQASRADVVAFATAGLDLQNAVKQAKEFGLDRRQQLVAMLMSLMEVHNLGLESASGMMFADSFYWDRDDDSRKFAAKFFTRMKRMPTALQAAQYSGVLNYLKAIERARTDDALEVVKAMKAAGTINDAYARNGRLREDNKMIHDMYLVQVKKPQESTKPFDYLRIVSTVPGIEAFPPIAASKCSLVKK